MLVIKGILKSSVLEHFEDGLILETEQTSTIVDVFFRNRNQYTLFHDVSDFFDVPVENFVINPNGDQPSRFDFVRYEDADGAQVDDLYNLKFKEGLVKRWFCEYSCFVDIISPYRLRKG